MFSPLNLVCAVHICLRINSKRSWSGLASSLNRFPGRKGNLWNSSPFQQIWERKTWGHLWNSVVCVANCEQLFSDDGRRLYIYPSTRRRDQYLVRLPFGGRWVGMDNKRPYLGTGASDTGKSSGSPSSLPSWGGGAKRLTPHLSLGSSGLCFGAYLRYSGWSPASPLLHGI